MTTQLQERIAEIAGGSFPQSQRECGLCIQALTALATDPVLREEIEKPLRAQIAKLEDINVQLQNQIVELSKDWHSDVDCLVALRERIAELEADFEKARQWNELTELELKNLRSIKADQSAELLALQAQVAKMREALATIASDKCEFKGEEAQDALDSSSPDTSLRDRVVEVLSEFLNNCYPTGYEGGAWFQKARTLLADLGATNPEQPK